MKILLTNLLTTQPNDINNHLKQTIMNKKTMQSMDTIWFENRDLLKNLLQHIDIKPSIVIVPKEIHYKNGEIVYQDYELEIDYMDLASQLSNKLEGFNLTLKKI